MKLLTVVAVVAGLAAQAPTAPPQFRTGVELITLDVSVLDDTRQPVRGLTEADFTVLENGVARPIRAFTAVDLAPHTGTEPAVWANAIPADVVTNQAGEQEGRLVIILMDRSIPAERATLDARKIAAATVEALGPGDLGAIVSTSNGAVQNLTADRTRLLRAINHGDPSTGITPEQEQVFGKLDPLNDGRCLCGLCVLETITRVADAVRAAPRRRKVLVFIGSSLTFQSMRPITELKNDPGCDYRLRHARDEMFTAVDRANLTVHSIDPQGLVNLGPQTRAGIGGGIDRPGNSGPAVRLKQQQDDTSNLLASQQSLQVLTARTGGRAVVNRNNAHEIVPAVFRESEAYYVLGVERGPSEGSDASHALDVKVKRKGVRVIAQRQYVPPSQPRQRVSTGASASASEEALDALLPRARVPLAFSVNTFAGRDDAIKAIVRVNVDASAFARTDGPAVPLDVAVKAVDPTGRPVAAARQTSTIGGASHGDRRADVVLQSHLELPPGDYGIRVAVTDTTTGAVASVFSDVTVPRFVSAPLSLSDVAVEAARGPETPQPTTRRLFRRTDRVRAVMQIYQGTARSEPLASVSVRVQILDAKGATVRDQSLPFGAETFVNRRTDCVMTLPIANLPQGDYLLELDASIDRHTTGRTLRFAVE